jgi:chromosome segregation ATPase
MSALEANAPADFARLERDRTAELERSLGSVGSEHESLRRQLAQLKETVDLEKQLRAAAEEREGEAVRRATILEKDHARTTEELHDLHEKHAQAESALRENADRMLSHESTIQQHLVDLTATRAMHNEVLTSRDGHVQVIAELQAALQHSGGRATEAESLYQSERGRAEELESEVEHLRRELDTRSHEADAATARLADIESSWARSRDEADSLRTTTTGGLAALLAHHAQSKTDHANSIRGHEDKVQAMDQEASSLRKMLREAGIRIDESQAALGEQRRRARQLEQEHGTSRSEVQAARSSLSVALADTGRLREQLATREAEVKDAQSAVSELEVRLAMMRGLLADSGIAVNEDDLRSEESVPSHRLRDVESKLSEKAQQHEETERELDLSQRRIEMAEAKVADLTNQLEALKARIGQDGVLSPTPDSLRQLESRAEIAEKQLKDTLLSKTQVRLTAGVSLSKRPS